MDSESFASGILIFRSVRSHFASFTLIPLKGDDITKASNETINKQDAIESMLVRLQFFDEIKQLRSFFRRAYKLGDIVDIKGGRWEKIDDKEHNTGWMKPRLVIDFRSLEEAKSHVHVRHSQYWKMPQCQAWQNRLFKNCSKRTENVQNTSKARKKKTDKENNHVGGLGKRQQGEMIADFLINCIMYELSFSEDGYWKKKIPKPSDWREEFGKQEHSGLKMKAIEYLNSGTGVIDVAGGSGHVSMALGMAGVKSTIVDARMTIGKLPGRDRKVWNRALKTRKNNSEDPNGIFCQPIVPFETHRAWFGSLPSGVDKTFRHADEEEILLCDKESDLIKDASAVVALHPDEATGDIVHVAVEKRIPFVAVPCCVFCRLFPNRRKLSDNQVVSSYEDLVEYLIEQDITIQQTQLPFEGKNNVLWSTFSMENAAHS
jgi:hypothetical protein